MKAEMTAWDIAPGKCPVTTGTDTDGDDRADAGIRETRVPLERTGSLEMDFRPRKTTVIECALMEKSSLYLERPDLGIDPDNRIREIAKRNNVVVLP